MIKSAFRDFIFVIVVAVLLGTALGLFCAFPLHYYVN